MNRYRLSLDLGTNSVGWCALVLEQTDEHNLPVSILDMGVRIFPDGRNPKDGSSNAEARRKARGMSRNRDRFLVRREKLLDDLVSFGLLPRDESQRRALVLLDPYELRVRGITEKLTPYEFGRALFHLNQRRGFKSNRKSDSKASDAGAIKHAVKELEQQMAAIGAKTFGQFLYARRTAGNHVRSRLKTRKVVKDNGREKNEDYYEFYPTREALSAEFQELWRVQAQYHPTLLTDNARNELYKVIFYQRPLKPTVVGDCIFERSEKRAARALPVVQRLRIYQELNHLQILDAGSRSRPLTLEERDRLAALLCRPIGKKSGKSELTFDRMRRVLNIGDATFSHESDKRKSFEADSTSALLAHGDRFGSRWHDMTDEEQESVLESLMEESDEENLIQLLMADWGLDREHAETIATTPLPQGYGRLGHTASAKILEQLVGEVIPYSEAVVRVGYSSHSQFATGAARDRLPYYGEVLERHVILDPEKGGCPAAPLELRFGKVGNPTVHIALNQMRKVVNEVIKLHGKPAEIHLEVLRDLKNSLKKRQEIEVAQKDNQDENDRCRKILEEKGIHVNRENIQRLRLWREMPAENRCCVYSGSPISDSLLFTDAVEIDHILPFSRTWDDGMSNKVLCMRDANREKTNRSPFETWGMTERWEDILVRSRLLPKAKRWRFTEDAMNRWQEEGGFLSRQLTDSQYIAKLAREYLCTLFSPQQAAKVVCLPGRLTGLFRGHLGLADLLDEVNPDRQDYNVTRGVKNRADHRHHAVDALVVGLMDRSFLQRAATVSARLEEEGVYRLLAGMQEPWPAFHRQAQEAVDTIIVSHKTDHGIAGPLHNDTAYGFAREGDPRGNAIHRVPASSITLKNLQNIKGKKIRADLLSHLYNIRHDEAFNLLQDADSGAEKLADILKKRYPKIQQDEKEVKKSVIEFFDRHSMRRVRLIENIALKEIKDHCGRVYKGFKPDGNAYLDVYYSEDGNRWEGKMVTRFDANQRVQDRNGSEGAGVKRVIRLFNRDMLEMEHNGARKIFYIQKMSENQIALAEHFEANTDSRTRDKDDPFSLVYKGSVEALRKAKVRFLTVTPAGRIRYLSDNPDDSPRD